MNRRSMRVEKDRKYRVNYALTQLSELNIKSKTQTAKKINNHSKAKQKLDPLKLEPLPAKEPKDYSKEISLLIKS